mgnify:CR=1 FL=1
MFSKLTVALTLAAAFLMPSAAFAADEAAASPAVPGVDEIVNMTNQASYYQGSDGRAKVHMTITDEQGRAREREFVILRWDAPEAGSDVAKKDQTFTGGQKFYVYFERPADVNKMAFLVWKHLDKSDDRWLYLPALDLVKRIAASDKRTSFVGSSFFYEDVSGRHIDEDTHELVKVTGDYYVLKNTPKDPDSVEFAYYEMYVHKKTFVVVETDYYDKQGQKYRTYKAEKVETIDGYPTVTKSSMTDTKNGSKTEMDYSEVKYNLDIPEDVFTERYLRQLPYEFLR